MYYNKKKTIIIVMIAVIMLMATGYAYFATQLNITVTGSVSSSWLVHFISITEGDNNGTTAENTSTPSAAGTTATMGVDLKVPGDKMTYELVLKNDGNVPAIIEAIDANGTGTAAIIYSINGIQIGDILEAGDEVTITIVVEYDSRITNHPENATKVLTVNINAVQYTGQVITPTDPEIIQPSYSNLATAILFNNTAYADNVRSPYVDSDTGISFGSPSSDTNGKGLYYTSTNTENNGITYYFRGDVENNYVKFGTETINTKFQCSYNGNEVRVAAGDPSIELGPSVTDEETCLSTNICHIDNDIIGDVYMVGTTEENCSGIVHMGTWIEEKATWASDLTLVKDVYWRIVRINEDGSIRLIYNGNSIDVDEGTYIDFIWFSDQYQEGKLDNAYVGYMYGTPGSDNYEDTHANVNDSDAKKVIDEWYETNLKTNYASFLADAGFCNDRSVAPSAGLWDSLDTALGYGTNTTFYGGRNRQFAGIPQFACPNKERDLFTTSSSSKGNKALKYPIGMITYDEVVFAIGYGGTDQFKKSYLFLNFYEYTMTPGNVENDEDDNTGDGGVLQIGGGSGTMVYGAIRPVINLKSNVKIVSGNGTQLNPYIIKTN